MRRTRLATPHTPSALVLRFLGTSWDSEGGSRFQANALGDDNDGIDDEDGVTPKATLYASSAFDVVPDFSFFEHFRVTTHNVGAGAYLDAWIDFDHSGTFDSFEHLGAGASFTIASGVSAIGLDVTVPAGAALGDTYARFRISRAAASVHRAVNRRRSRGLQGHDPSFRGFRRRAASYGTLLADDGAGTWDAAQSWAAAPEIRAIHRLRSRRAPASNADGDDDIGNDDENGVVVPLPLYASSGSRICPITCTCMSPSHPTPYPGGPEQANLDAWIDFDRSGTFDADELSVRKSTRSAYAGPNYRPGRHRWRHLARFRISRGGAARANRARRRRRSRGPQGHHPVADHGQSSGSDVDDSRTGLHSVEITDAGDGHVTVASARRAPGASIRGHRLDSGRCRRSDGLHVRVRRRPGRKAGCRARNRSYRNRPHASRLPDR